MMPRTSATAAAWACALGLSGCGGDVLDGADFWSDKESRVAQLFPVANRIALTPIWDYGTGYDYRDVDSQIVPWIDDEHVFLAGPGGGVVALRASTGGRIWEADVPGLVLAGAAADGERVYAGTWEREVFALDRATGGLIWRRTLPSEVLQVRALEGGRMAARTNDGRLSVLSAEDGSLLWSHVHSSPSLTLRGAGAPLGDGDRLLAGFDDGKLMAFDAASGLRHWEARLAMPTGRTELDRIVDVDGHMQLGDGVAYAAALYSQVGAVQTVEGSLLWSKEIEARHGPGLDEVSVYVADTHGAVWSLDRANGGVHWQQEALAYRDLSAPVPTGLHVIVVDFEGYMHWLRITDGEIVARHEVGDALQAPPQVRLDRIYLLHRNGRFAVYQFVPLQSAAAE